MVIDLLVPSLIPVLCGSESLQGGKEAGPDWKEGWQWQAGLALLPPFPPLPTCDDVRYPAKSSCKILTLTCTHVVHLIVPTVPCADQCPSEGGGAEMVKMSPREQSVGDQLLAQNEQSLSSLPWK